MARRRVYLMLCIAAALILGVLGTALGQEESAGEEGSATQEEPGSQEGPATEEGDEEEVTAGQLRLRVRAGATLEQFRRRIRVAEQNHNFDLAKTDADLQTIFQSIDQDGNGRINRAEIRAFDFSVLVDTWAAAGDCTQEDCRRECQQDGDCPAGCHCHENRGWCACDGT